MFSFASTGGLLAARQKKSTQLYTTVNQLENERNAQFGMMSRSYKPCSSQPVLNRAKDSQIALLAKSTNKQHIFILTV